MDDEMKLLPCPFCGGEAEIRLSASGMETPEPFAACKAGCVVMKPVRCDDWPYGRERGYLTSKQARAAAIAAWNNRIASRLEADEVITPAMQTAGVKAFEEAGLNNKSKLQVAEAIYLAMRRAAQEPTP